MFKQRQRGATMWTTLSIVLMIGFIAMIAFKLAPVYLDHRIIRASMQEVANQHDFGQKTQMEVLNSVQKRLDIEGISIFTRENFSVVREKSGAKYIQIKYSQKVPMMGNVSALIEFEDQVRPARNQ